MNLYIHLPTNLKLFELFVENKDYLVGWNSKNEKQIAEFFLKNFPGEVMDELSPQYEINFLAIRKLKKFDNNIFNRIQWIYYWSDNCEYLSASVWEIQKAYDLFVKAKKKYYFQWWFVFVTPYVWDKMLQQLKEWLVWLNQKATKKWIEVVVNDLWVLNFVLKECKNLKPIIGRLLHKLLKTPLVDTYWNHAHVPWILMRNKKPAEIEQIQKEIIKNQEEFYNSVEASFQPFVNFAEKKWIKRVGIDFMWKRRKLYQKDYKLWIDLYYPWAIVWTGRLCDTSAINQPARGHFAIDDVCPRTCWKYDLFFKLKTVWYKLIQRWNSWFRSEIDIDNLSEQFLFNPKNRLIFAPFVAV